MCKIMRKMANKIYFIWIIDQKNEKLVLKGSIIKEVNIQYNRRTAEEGEKLKISDSWNIIWTMIRLKFYSKTYY